MTETFLKGEKVTRLVAHAWEIRNSKKQFSDIIDVNGYQYVDLVQEGGGVLGIGLIGYTYILEQAGIRFYSLAGTSAGAISTLLMAGLGKVGEPISIKILKILSEKNLFDFVDGPKGVKHLIQRTVEGKKGLVWRLIWYSFTLYYLLRYKLGLNPGSDFEVWLNQQLEKVEISNYADLAKRRKQLPELHNRLNTKKVLPPKLALVTSEITTHTKVDLPRMAGLYWKDLENVPPARFVRASMSIPIFFYPYVKKDLPNAGKFANAEWKEYAGYDGEIPKSVKFVDGGLLSNFPINIFHKTGVPSRPTFGVRLSTYRKNYSQTSSFFSYAWAMIATMRQIHDYDVILQNPDYKKLICNIDADREFNWLNFNMSRERQQGLFILGAEKGLEFLKGFDWEGYKEVRKLIV